MDPNGIDRLAIEQARQGVNAWADHIMSELALDQKTDHMFAEHPDLAGDQT